MPAPVDCAPALQQALDRIGRREPLDAAALLAALGAEEPGARATASLALARAHEAAGQLDQARGAVQRAFLLAGGSREVLDHFVRIHRALGDAPAIRAARKRVALAAAQAGDVAATLEACNAWQYSDAELSGEDRYAYDQEVLDAVARLARPLRRPLPARAPPAGRKLRIAQLVFGATHFNSVIVRIDRLLAQHHDRSRFELAFFVPDPRSQVEASRQGPGHLAWFREQGCAVEVAPDGPAPERLLALVDSIRAFAPDLLVMDAALADFHHYFVQQLRPAPAVLGLVSGPPPQFAPPDLDWGIAWTWHPLVDAPVPCSHVPLETFLPGAAAVAPRARSALGLPEEAVVIGTAGRALKHRNPRHWTRLAQLLLRFPAAHLLCVGPKPADLPRELAAALAPLRQQLHFCPWMENYLEVFGQVDLVVDTWPSGGGVVLADAMALGKPVITFENDYGKPYDQADWLPAREWMPAGDLVVPRGDEARFQEVAARLVTDAPYRAEMGRRCRETVLERLGQPARMVRRCEEVFARVATACAGRTQ
jgi:glycosyltransferase involved in cell wall biosynthesis